MKKIILVLGLLITLVAGSVYAAGTVTESYGYIGGNVYSLTLTWISATDGSLTAHTTSTTIKGFVFLATTNPDTTAGGDGPSDNYDITVTNSDGIDIFGGSLANRDSTASEYAIPLFTTGVYYTPISTGVLTFTLTNNSVNSAKGKLVLYWEGQN